MIWKYLSISNSDISIDHILKLKACKDADKKLEEAGKIDWTKFPSLGSAGPLVQIKPSIFSGCLKIFKNWIVNHPQVSPKLKAWFFFGCVFLGCFGNFCCKNCFKILQRRRYMKNWGFWKPITVTPKSLDGGIVQEESIEIRLMVSALCKSDLNSVAYMEGISTPFSCWPFEASSNETTQEWKRQESCGVWHEEACRRHRGFQSQADQSGCSTGQIWCFQKVAPPVLAWFFLGFSIKSHPFWKHPFKRGTPSILFEISWVWACKNLESYMEITLISR